MKYLTQCSQLSCEVWRVLHCGDRYAEERRLVRKKAVNLFKRRIEFSNLILSVAWKPLQLPGHLCFFIVNRVDVWSLLISSGEPLLCSALIAEAGRTGAIREASLQTQHAVCSSVHWPASAISLSWTVLCEFHFYSVCGGGACLCILVWTSRWWTGFIVRTFSLVCGPHNFIIQCIYLYLY